MRYMFLRCCAAQQPSEFWLTHGVARSVCGSRASCRTRCPVASVDIRARSYQPSLSSSGAPAGLLGDSSRYVDSLTVVLAYSNSCKCVSQEKAFRPNEWFICSTQWVDCFSALLNTAFTVNVTVRAVRLSFLLLERVLCRVQIQLVVVKRQSQSPVVSVLTRLASATHSCQFMPVQFIKRSDIIQNWITKCLFL